MKDKKDIVDIVQRPAKPIEPETEITEDSEGQKWVTVRHTKLFHRKTFIKGKLISKYNGELDYIKDAQGFVKEKYFDFSLYDAEIKDSIFRMNNEGIFPEFKSEELFPGTIHPSPLPCKISYQQIQGDFEVILYDLKLANIDFNKHRALHQEEDDQVFGTVEADITGYILEEFTEEYDEMVKVEEKEAIPNLQIQVLNTKTSIFKTSEKTGRTKTQGNYTWDEFWYSDKKTTYWGNPRFIGNRELGCFTGIWQLIGVVLGILFLFAIGPQGIIVLMILAAIILFIAYFFELLKWALRIAGLVILVFAIMGLISALRNNKFSDSKPFAKDDVKEVKIIERDRTGNSDSIIVHHRIWKDYDGKKYEGDIWVRVKDFEQTGYFKNNLVIQSSSIFAYDKVLFYLIKQDSSKLYGVYRLLDSIRLGNNQTDIQFAETLVSFVQDIPYALVLDNACDARLYDDKFTVTYLKSQQGECDGYQKFGINSPVEFMGTLKGDCDTRSLLLYTMLSHYQYDVAILSSELYSHSIFAINLPLTGKSISANGKRYVVWETTAPGIRAGLLPEELSNFNNWRISLISKP